MKYLALAIAAVGMVASQAKAQLCVPIYDTTGAPGINFTGMAGNNLMGDNYLPPVPPVGNNWEVCDVNVVVVATGPGTCNLTVNWYDLVNAGPPPIGPAYGNLNTSVTVPVTFPNPPPPYPQAFLVTISGVGVCLPNPPGPLGLGIEFVSDCPGIMTFGFADFGSTVAGSAWSNGFDFDLNVNGLLENNEFVNVAGWVNGNVMWSQTATPAICTPLLGPASSDKAYQVKVRPIPNMPLNQVRSFLANNTSNTDLRELKTK